MTSDRLRQPSEPLFHCCRCPSRNSTASTVGDSISHLRIGLCQRYAMPAGVTDHTLEWRELVLKRIFPAVSLGFNTLSTAVWIAQEVPAPSGGSVHSAPSGAPATMAVSPANGQKRPVQKGHSHMGQDS